MIPTIHTLAPAYPLIEKLGGKAAVASELGINKSTLSRWCAPPPGGLGGVVPQRYWNQLIAMGKRNRVPVSLRELTHIKA
jgi:hypothetical protein